ncbi:MAG TPA: DUF4159 domain-containing protein [Verrucomicrobiae bacterium]|nr:DUF4159 domain-containing protein [Verrucomicrobiae bacterium]
MFQRNQLRRAGALVAGGISIFSALYAFQKPFRSYPGLEYSNWAPPPDKNTLTEWTFARLMYPPVGRYYGGVEFYGSWKEGGSNWTMDYPRSDRHLAMAVSRLTRIHVRQAEEPIDLDDNDVYDWPWLYAVEVGHWSLTDSQAKTLREYLDRGGFLMVDDFHGDVEWRTFYESLHKVFPDRQVVDLEDSNSIFHTLYDLDHRYQVPGALYLETGLTYEKGESGRPPHWRAIYDDRGRVVVAICHNMDLGDSWEHADNPQYPADFSNLGIRIGINYIVYAFTH